ncbi:hypothetical protein ABIC45_002854 [Mucilaginibacter rubeus]
MFTKSKHSEIINNASASRLKKEEMTRTYLEEYDDELVSNSIEEGLD